MGMTQGGNSMEAMIFAEIKMPQKGAPFGDLFDATTMINRTLVIMDDEKNVVKLHNEQIHELLNKIRQCT